jgi:hypothetical protein
MSGRRPTGTPSSGSRAPQPQVELEVIGQTANDAALFPHRAERADRAFPRSPSATRKPTAADRDASLASLGRSPR